MSSKFVKNSNAVNDDRNWIGRIQNETVCANVWEKDWGFLAGGTVLDKSNFAKMYTVDDKIKTVQEELEKLFF